MIKNFKWLLLVSLSFVACNNDDDNTPVEVPVTSGSADLSKYVALGDSFAAGFSDYALFKKGQEGGYPNIMSQQFAFAGGGDFSTPFMSDDNIGGFSMGGVQIAQFPTRLYFNGAGPANLPGVSGTEITAHLSGSFNNMGIPGAKCIHLDYPGYALGNPYFGRFASSTMATVVNDAVSQDPTFFSLWIGGNDVLSYAFGGGVTTAESSSTGNDITPPSAFDGAYNGLVAKLTANGAKGVVANLPYVNALPFFTTVPFNPVPLDASTVALLSGASGYGAYNGGLQFAIVNNLLTPEEAARRTVTFHVGNGNAVVIVDNYLTNLSGYGIPSYRQATAEDFLILPSRSFIGTYVGGNPTLVNGVSVPLADNWVLSKDEAAAVRIATDAYNVTIENAALANDLAFVDTKAVMNDILDGGLVFGNYNMTSAYIFGGAFSLDGVHPSPRGYALIANKFLESINTKYGSTLRTVKSSDYRILYPFAF